ARPHVRARGNGRDRDLRRSALSAASVLVRQRRGRPLMSQPAAAEPDIVVVDAGRLTAAVADIFIAVGIAADDAKTVSADLVAADLEGMGSHGVMLAPMYVDRILGGSVSRASGGEVVGARGGAIVIDAGHALGQLTSRQAVRLAIASAREHGLAAVAVRNGFH